MVLLKINEVKCLASFDFMALEKNENKEAMAIWIEDKGWMFSDKQLFSSYWDGDNWGPPVKILNINDSSLNFYYLKMRPDGTTYLLIQDILHGILSIYKWSGAWEFQHQLKDHFSQIICSEIDKNGDLVVLSEQNSINIINGKELSTHKLKESKYIPNNLMKIMNNNLLIMRNNFDKKTQKYFLISNIWNGESWQENQVLGSDNSLNNIRFYTVNDKVLIFWKESQKDSDFSYLKYSIFNGYNWSEPVIIANDCKEYNCVVNEQKKSVLLSWKSKEDLIYTKIWSKDEWINSNEISMLSSDFLNLKIVNNDNYFCISWICENILQCCIFNGREWKTYEPVIEDQISKIFNYAIEIDNQNNILIIFSNSNPSESWKYCWFNGVEWSEPTKIPKLYGTYILRRFLGKIIVFGGMTSSEYSIFSNGYLSSPVNCENQELIKEFLSFR